MITPRTFSSFAEQEKAKKEARMNPQSVAPNTNKPKIRTIRDVISEARTAVEKKPTQAPPTKLAPIPTSEQQVPFTAKPILENKPPLPVKEPFIGGSAPLSSFNPPVPPSGPAPGDSLFGLSRPITPRDVNRKLFLKEEYQQRPTSSYAIKKSALFSQIPNPNPQQPAPLQLNQLSDPSIENPDQLKSSLLTPKKSESEEVKPKKRKKIATPTSSTPIASSASTTKKKKTKEEFEEIVGYLNSLLNMNQELGQIYDKEILKTTLKRMNCMLNSPEFEQKLALYKESNVVHSNMLFLLSNLMDCPDEEVLLLVCKAMLLLNPEDSFLNSITKVLFKLSKNESLDALFKENDVIEHLVKIIESNNYFISKKLNWEALLYTMACLKNISCSTSNQEKMVTLGIMPVLLKKLSSINSAIRLDTSNSKNNSSSSSSATTKEEEDQHAQMLIQIIAIFRNLASTSENVPHLAENGTIETVISLMDKLSRHEELILNCSRLCSKLSVTFDILQQLNTKISIQVMCSLLAKHKMHKPIVVRLLFIFANLTFAFESARTEIYSTKRVTFLLDLLELYSEELKIYSTANKNKESAETSKSGKQKKDLKLYEKETQNLLKYLIRCLANLSMIDECGKEIVNSPKISIIVDLLEAPDPSDEDSQLNLLRCLTNLTFFGPETGNQIFSRKAQMCQILAPLLLSKDQILLFEACRTFGNLTRDQGILNILHTNRVDEIFLILLDHSNAEVVEAVCGILLNLSNNDLHAKKFGDYEIAKKLFDVIEVFEDNESLVELVFMLLHNLLLIHQKNIGESFNDIYKNDDDELVAEEKKEEENSKSKKSCMFTEKELNYLEVLVAEFSERNETVSQICSQISISIGILQGK